MNVTVGQVRQKDISMKSVTKTEFLKVNTDGVEGFQTFYRDGLLVQRKIYANGYTEEVRGEISYYI